MSGRELGQVIKRPAGRDDRRHNRSHAYEGAAHISMTSRRHRLDKASRGLNSTLPTLPFLSEPTSHPLSFVSAPCYS